MNTIFASLRTIAFGAAVLVAGVMVRRSSLLGFDVGASRGLDATEAMQAIEAAIVDQSWPAPSARAVRPGVASTSRRASLMATVIDASKGLRGVTIRNAPLAGGYERVAVSCSAGRGCSRDEHMMVARSVAATLRGEGLTAVVDGSTVIVMAA
jgi:hypothetical protein